MPTGGTGDTLNSAARNRPGAYMLIPLLRFKRELKRYAGGPIIIMVIYRFESGAGYDFSTRLAMSTIKLEWKGFEFIWISRQNF
jgi:hypothetical protein